MTTKTAAGLFVSLVMLVAAAPANAQTSDGRIVGIILDSSGAAVPGARVSARNVETGVEHTAQSNAEGNYLLYPLRPGVYDITAEARGFSAERIAGVRVEVGMVLTRDIRLKVGSQQETVTVSAEAAPVVTESPSVESTMLREQIQALPLNARDFNQLVL